MRDLFEICGECRHLSDAQVVYRITNSEKASKEVERMLVQEDKVTIEDICQKLTPARRDMALAVVELYRRLSERKVNAEIIRSSKDIYRVMTPCMHDLKIEESKESNSNLRQAHKSSVKSLRSIKRSVLSTVSYDTISRIADNAAEKRRLFGEMANINNL